MRTLLCLRMTAMMISNGSKYLITLNTLRIFSMRDTRNTLNVGPNRLKIGRMDSRSMIAIGVKGYITKAAILPLLES